MNVPEVIVKLTLSVLYTFVLSTLRKFVKDLRLNIDFYFQNEIAGSLSDETWVFTIEQTFLLLIIFARWILPKGRLSRDKLSQLLFVFLSKASDVTDFFQLFDEEQVKRNSVIVYSILSIWTLSVFQFGFVLTETKDKDTGSDVQSSGLNTCIETDVWSNIVSLVMEEIPFFVVRMYAIATYNLVTYSIIFFASKNMLMITMLAYRLFSVYNDVRETRTVHLVSPTPDKLKVKPANSSHKDLGSTAHGGYDAKKRSNDAPSSQKQARNPRRPQTFVIDIDEYINS